MEVLQSIKLFSIPTWLKLFIAALLGVLGFVNMALFFMGILNEHREGWVKASVELLSVVLPIFILALVLWKSEAGVESLRRKTEDFFLNLLPSVLGRLTESGAPFFEAKPDHELDDLHSGVKVLVNLQKNDCYSDVIILAPDLGGYVEVTIRLELNVKKVNFNLCLDEQLVLARYEAAHPGPPSAGADSPAEVTSWIFQRFKHTAGGATFQGGEDEHAGRKTAAAGYRFNPNLLRRTVGGRTALCIVASCSVASDFLYDPGERLFFAQDLMFFLRSFLTEGRDLFRTIPREQLQQTVAELCGKRGRAARTVLAGVAGRGAAATG